MTDKNSVIAFKLLRARLFILCLTGGFTFILQRWSTEYPGIAELVARIVFYVYIFFAILADEMKGTLKASPVYRATFQQTTQLPFVQGLIAVYLTILAFLSLYIAWSDDAIEISPDHTWRIFLIVAPLFLVVFAGKYIIEREQNS